MQNQASTPSTLPPKAVTVPAPTALYPNLKPRPEQAANPNAQRQQEQAQQQIQQ